MEWKQTTRSTTIEEGATPEDGIYIQREVLHSLERINAGLHSNDCRAGENEGCSVTHCECARHANEAEKLEVRVSFHQHPRRYSRFGQR